MQVSYENERDGDRPGLRVVGSSKQLQDDVLRETLQEQYSSDEDDFTEFEIDSDVERENPGANEPKADSDEDSDIQVSLERVLCYV